MQSNHPDKQKVRDWLKDRHRPDSIHKPDVPTPEEIRRELGWGLTDYPQQSQDDPEHFE